VDPQPLIAAVEAGGRELSGPSHAGGSSGRRARLRRPWSDRRAGRALGAVACLACVAVVAMIAFVAVRAWPAFAHNGLAWLGSGGELGTQVENMLATSTEAPAAAFHLRAWPIVYGTLLTTGLALALALPLAVLAAVFIVELAPASLRRAMVLVVRLLASVPSVIWGLIGVLVLVPYVGNHVISPGERDALAGTVQLTGAGLIVAVLVLALMITPIMVALVCDALAAVPASWREGAAALGCNRVRAIRAVTLRAIRPAIVAAAVLATARALGEAIMISMVSGSVFFAPRPGDGVAFFFEPLRTLASTIVDFREGAGAPALNATLYAFALLLLFSAFALSLAGFLIKLPLRRYQVRA
jgi:ABC-type phosphate transport system permease subunit